MKVPIEFLWSGWEIFSLVGHKIGWKSNKRENFTRYTIRFEILTEARGGEFKLENSTYVFLRIVVPLLLHLLSCLPDLVSIYHLSSSVIVLINESETEVIRFQEMLRNWSAGLSWLWINVIIYFNIKKEKNSIYEMK